MGGFCLLVELYWEGSAPAACTAGLFVNVLKTVRLRSFKQLFKKKIRIRETSNLLTDADSSTDNTVKWTKNTQKPKKIKSEKNNPKRKNVQF